MNNLSYRPYLSLWIIYEKTYGYSSIQLDPRRFYQHSHMLHHMWTLWECNLHFYTEIAAPYIYVVALKRERKETENMLDNLIIQMTEHRMSVIISISENIFFIFFFFFLHIKASIKAWRIFEALTLIAL